MRSGQIRPAQVEDLAEVLATEDACFSQPWSAQSFAGLLKRPEVLFRVLTCEGGADSAMVGHGILWCLPPEGELANLAIRPEMQGRGWGEALVRALLAEAQGAGVRQVFLEVRESNTPARALYRRCGFEPIGRRSAYYQKPVEDALVLRWTAPDPSSGE
jgi:ribosomal-protein-alanine N-acetyltransferase